ncbi:bromodomain-containing protein 4-like [Podarcis lilfordi]|uniref:Bromodomain-containing protein 4-like n=1 Tax=Podarcis lilfordi TaxID=74358 RepID=A0AA35QQK4_9SAUR|nr:bromodomain-containing protein 4-like [Podarcis lilfordi]
MGSGNSKCTPLQCFLNNWKLATKDDDWGFKLKKERLRTLCEVDWPTQRTGWPSQGTLDGQLINPLWQRVIDNHPDQIPYISTWKTNVDKNPPWLKACRTVPPQARICAVRQQKLPPVVQDTEEDELLVRPPPYTPPAPAPPPQNNPQDNPPNPVGGSLINPIPETKDPSKSETDKEDESDDGEEDEGTMLRMLEEKVVKGQKWSKKQEEWIKDYVDPYKDQVDVSPHILEVARCEDGRWKKKQKRWLAAARRAATHHDREREKKDLATAVMPLRRAYDPPGPAGQGGAAAPRLTQSSMCLSQLLIFAIGVIIIPPLRRILPRLLNFLKGSLKLMIPLMMMYSTFWIPSYQLRKSGGSTVKQGRI